MLMNYHIGRLVLSSLCVGVFVASGIWWCSFCRLNKSQLVGQLLHSIHDARTHVYKKKSMVVFLNGRKGTSFLVTAFVLWQFDL